MALNPLGRKINNSEKVSWKNSNAAIVGLVLLFEMYIVIKRNHTEVGALGFCGILLIQFFYIFYKNKRK